MEDDSSSSPNSHKLIQPTLIALSLSRILFGSASIITPKFISNFCGLPFAPQSSPILLRAFGSRDAAIGLYLWQTRHDVEARRPALMLGLAVDIVDAGAALVSFYQGSLALKPAVIVGGGAVALAVLGAVALSVDGRSIHDGKRGVVQLK